MPGSPSQSTIYRFGAFEVNATSGELRKHGLRIRLQDQPLEVLVSLLERPGELVTREALVQRLWPDGTIVDFDRGLNAAVARLRQALSDSAETPVYVETVARRGYRFVATLNGPSAEDSPERDEASPPQKSRWLGMRRNVAAASLLIPLLLGGAALWLRWPHPPAAKLPDGPWNVAPLTSAPGVERNPSFSPDGTQIAYEWDSGDGRPHVHVKLAGPGDPIRLTPAATSDFGPAWSPDGARIAFVRVLSESSIGVFVAPALGGAERRVAENPSPEYWLLRQHRRRLAWTADSSHLVVSGPDRPGAGDGLFLVSVASGARTWLTQPSPVSAVIGDREPAVSPDGRTLAFARGEANASERIYLLDLSEDLRPQGEPRRLDAVKSGRSPAWTPDGRAILFTPINPSYNFGSGLFTVELTASSPKAIPDAGWGVTLPAVAATGRRLAWGQVTRKLSIWRQRISTPGQPGSLPERLTPESGQSVSPQYSPDGARIAFASNRSGSTQIWTCASDGSHCAQVTSFTDGLIAGSPRWSPDGAWLAFDSGSDGRSGIYVVDAHGGVPRRLTHGPTPSAIPSWSRDGRSIYFSQQTPGEPEIWKIAAAGGTPVRITRGLVAFESVDGRSLLFTRGDRTATLYRLNLDGSGEEPLIEGLALRAFAVAADRIYWLKEEPKGRFAIHQFLLSSRQSSRVADIAGEAFLGLSLSSDGKYVAYTRTDQLSTSLVLAESAAR